MTYCQHPSTLADWNSSGTPMHLPVQSNYAPSASYLQPRPPVSNCLQQNTQHNCSHQNSQSNHSYQHAQPNSSQQHVQPNYSQQQVQPNYSQQHFQPDQSQQHAQLNHIQQHDQQLQKPDPAMSQSDVDAVLNSMKNFVCPRGCFPQGMVDNMTYNPHNSRNNTRNPDRNTSRQANDSYNQSSMPNNHIAHNYNTPQSHNYSQNGQCPNNYTTRRNNYQVPQNISYQGHQKSHDHCSHNPQNREYLAHIPGHIKPQQVYRQPSVQEGYHQTSPGLAQSEPHLSALQHLHETQEQEAHRCAKAYGNMCGEGNICLNNKSEDMFPVICRKQLDELQPVEFRKNGLRSEKSDGLQGTRTRSGPAPKGWLLGPSKSPRSKKSYF